MSSSSLTSMTVHRILQDVDHHNVRDLVSWDSTGAHEFAKQIMPCYFHRQTKYKSFQRQLNLCEFTRIHQGQNKGSYWNKLFCRSGNPIYSLLMQWNRNIQLHSKKARIRKRGPRHIILFRWHSLC